MISHPRVQQILEVFGRTGDRYRPHEHSAPLIAELCEDRDFLFDAIRHCLSRQGFLCNADNLSLSIFQYGDIGLAINLFVPLRDGAPNITHDNIHHHGWRLLTTGVVCGDGYEFINFRRGSYNNRSDDRVHLEVDEVSRHTRVSVRFIDSYTPHVIFHPPSLSATLALTSADRPLVNQRIKRHLRAFPLLRSTAVKLAHTMRLNDILGLNPIKGLYYHPEGGRIVETQNYRKVRDGNRQEVLTCIFQFLQQVGFKDADFLTRIARDAPQEAKQLVEKVLAGEPIAGAGIWGDPRRRFSKTQILQALDHTIPADV